MVVWWVDNNWLSNPNNFNLDIDAIDNQFSELTAQEKALIAIYPIQAFTINKNKSTAFSMSDAKFGTTGTHIGYNDKKDAFRHAFFNAINTRDVFGSVFPTILSGSSIVRLFATAHESEVPSQLQLEKQMDLFNNEVGIVYCWNCWTTSNNSIADALMIKLITGDLRYLAPLDHSDPYWIIGPDGTKRTATNGIIRTATPSFPTITALIPTN